MTITISKQKSKCNKNDYSLINLITTIINEVPKFNTPCQITHKGVWAWNLTNQHFTCSPGFYHIMNTSPKITPDLDFWLEQLAPDDLIKFADALDGILHDSQPRNFIFQVTTPDFRKKTIKCFIESLTNPIDDTHYIIGVFCDISETVFSEN